METFDIPRRQRRLQSWRSAFSAAPQQEIATRGLALLAEAQSLLYQASKLSSFDPNLHRQLQNLERQLQTLEDDCRLRGQLRGQSDRW